MMKRRVCEGEQGGIGRVQKLFRYSPVCVDTLLILVLLAACVQPCRVGLSREGKRCEEGVEEGKRRGGEHMSVFVVIR